MEVPKSRSSRVSWADQWDTNHSEPLHVRVEPRSYKNYDYVDTNQSEPLHVPVEPNYQNYDHVSPTTTTATSAAAPSKYGKKFSEGFEKTRVVASTGMKKVKEGTSTGFHWLKLKYHKTTQKH